MPTHNIADQPNAMSTKRYLLKIKIWLHRFRFHSTRLADPLWTTQKNNRPALSFITKNKSDSGSGRDIVKCDITLEYRSCKSGWSSRYLCAGVSFYTVHWWLINISTPVCDVSRWRGTSCSTTVLTLQPPGLSNARVCIGCRVGWVALVFHESFLSNQWIGTPYYHLNSILLTRE